MRKKTLDRSYYAMVFRSTTDTISTEKKVSRDFDVMIMPTPREISKSCGFAIRFTDVTEEQMISLSQTLTVDHSIYFIDAGDRHDKKIRQII